MRKIASILGLVALMAFSAQAQQGQQWGTQGGMPQGPMGQGMPQGMMGGQMGQGQQGTGLIPSTQSPAYLAQQQQIQQQQMALAAQAASQKAAASGGVDGLGEGGRGSSSQNFNTCACIEGGNCGPLNATPSSPRSNSENRH